MSFIIRIAFHFFLFFLVLFFFDLTNEEDLGVFERVQSLKISLSYLLFFAIRFGIRTGNLLAPTGFTLTLFISPRKTRRITAKARASLEQMF